MRDKAMSLNFIQAFSPLSNGEFELLRNQAETWFSNLNEVEIDRIERKYGAITDLDKTVEVYLKVVN